MTYNYDAEYDELQDEIKAGASDSGILSYPAVEQTDFDFVFSAEGADYYTDEVISVSVE